MDDLIGELRVTATDYATRYRWRVLSGDRRRVLREGTGDNYAMAGRLLGDAMQHIVRDRARNSVGAM